MEFNIIQILVLILVVMTAIKILFMVLKKSAFESFTKSYINSIKNKPWLYFCIYFSLSILCLYLIRTYTDPKITYTEIAACTMFMAFLVNAGMIGSTSIFENYDFSKTNWKMTSIYAFMWFFIMYKALEEIYCSNN